MKALRVHVTAFCAALLLVVSASAETHTVQMTTVNFDPVFVPADLTVRPGDTVVWVNVDPYFLDHTTVSGTGSADPLAGQAWDSGLLGSNQSFQHTFDTAGDFEYFSAPHEVAGMFGVIHVTDATQVGEPDVNDSTWGVIKKNFSLLLPRE